MAARAVLRSAGGAGREDRRGPRRPLDYGVRRRGPGGDEGGSAGRARRRRRSSHTVPAPLHRSGARQIDLLAPGASSRVDGARPIAAGSGAPRDAPGRTADVLPDFDRGRREPAGAGPDGPRRPGERGAGVDEIRFRRRGDARAEDARGVHPARGRHARERTLHLAQDRAGVRRPAVGGSVPSRRLDRQPPDLRALQQFACGVGDRARRRRAGRSGRGRAAGISAGAGQPGVRSGRRRAARSPADLRRSARDDSGARQHRGQRDQVLDDREAPGREGHGHRQERHADRPGSGERESPARISRASSNASIGAATSPSAAAASACRSRNASSRAMAARSRCAAPWDREPKST